MMTALWIFICVLMTAAGTLFGLWFRQKQLITEQRIMLEHYAALTRNISNALGTIANDVETMKRMF